MLGPRYEIHESSCAVGTPYRRLAASYGVWSSSTVSAMLALAVDRKIPGIAGPVYIHIRKRCAIWISASAVAHHREITPLYLIDNGNRLRARKWLRLPRRRLRRCFSSFSRSLTFRRALFHRASPRISAAGPPVIPIYLSFADTWSAKGSSSACLATFIHSVAALVNTLWE